MLRSARKVAFFCWPVIYFYLMLMSTGYLAPLAPMAASTLIFTFNIFIVSENNIPFPLFYLRGKWSINSCATKCCFFFLKVRPPRAAWPKDKLEFKFLWALILSHIFHLLNHVAKHQTQLFLTFFVIKIDYRFIFSAQMYGLLSEVPEECDEVCCNTERLKCNPLH